MRNLKTAKAFALLLGICLFISSCKNFEDFNEIEEVELSGDYAIPLINSSTSLQDILDETGAQNDLSGLVIADDGSMTVEYKNEAITQDVKAFFEDIPSFPIVIPFNSNEIPFDIFDGVNVSQIDLKSGTFVFDFESPHQEDVNVLITIPNLVKNGVAFNFTQEVPFNGNSPSVASSGPISLEGYSFNLPNGMLEVYYQAMNTNGDNVQINPIMGMAENWDYDYMQGVWERDTINLSTDTLELDIYDNWVEGDITFADPKLTMVLENSFGFPTMAQIEELKVITASGEEMNLESSMFDAPIYLNYPELSEINVSKQTILNFNNSNSNIADILNAKPSMIIYSITAIVNPDETTTMNGFMTDQSSMSIALETELPIHGTASGFEIEEPLDSDLSELDDIEWVEFKVITDNGMPIDLGIQLYFTDDDGNKIDSLYSGFENVTQSASVDGNGDVVSSTEKVTYIEVAAERMENIKQSNNLLVGATFSTVDGGNAPVKILTSHQLDIKVGMKVGIKN